MRRMTPAASRGLAVRRAAAQDRTPISRMLELYQHDLSDIWQQDLDDRGEYGYALDRFWSQTNCWPFVFMAAGKYAGFALVDVAVKFPGDDYWMDQFFVLRRYRRRGFGQAAAHHVFESLRGRWEVGQMPRNLPAQAFWRRVIAEYTGGVFTEHALTAGHWEGHVQRFRN
jgi:predicted acetyltransferase